MRIRHHIPVDLEAKASVLPFTKQCHCSHDLGAANIPLKFLLNCCRPPRPSRSLLSVQSAMRPSLSPLENGAYGTPFKVVSFVIWGPQPGPSGRASMRSTKEGIAFCSGAAMIVAGLRRVCESGRSQEKGRFLIEVG